MRYVLLEGWVQIWTYEMVLHVTPSKRPMMGAEPLHATQQWSVHFDEFPAEVHFSFETYVHHVQVFKRGDQLWTQRVAMHLNVGDTLTFNKPKVDLLWA
jgi:hypothetical protein